MAKFIVRVIDNDTGDEEILGMTYPNQQAAEKAAEEYNKKGYWAAVYQEMKRFDESLKEELWPKEHNETTVEYFETNEVMKAHVKDWLAAEHPTEFQIKDIPADLTWGDLIEKIKNPNKEGPAWDFQIDTEPREFLWQRACELYYLQTGEFLDKDFERIYNEKRTDLQTAEEKIKGEQMLKDRIADDPEAEEPAVEEKPEDENPFDLEW